MIINSDTTAKEVKQRMTETMNSMVGMNIVSPDIKVEADSIKDYEYWLNRVCNNHATVKTRSESEVMDIIKESLTSEDNIEKRETQQSTDNCFDTAKKGSEIFLGTQGIGTGVNILQRIPHMKKKIREDFGEDDYIRDDEETKKPEGPTRVLKLTDE